jgi:hypothetical protein
MYTLPKDTLKDKQNWNWYLYISSKTLDLTKAADIPPKNKS